MKPLMLFVLFVLMATGSGMAQPLLQIEETRVVDRRTEREEEVLPVVAGKKLEIRFTARTSGAYALENDARIRLREPHGAAASVNLVFSGESGRVVEEVKLPVLSQTPREYGRVMYVPTGATALRLVLDPRGNQSLEVGKVVVTQNLEGIEADCLNPHPNFGFGDLNPYGFASGYGGGFYQLPDGRTIWNTGFTGRSPEFPVEGGTTYELSAKGTGYSGKKSRLVLQFYGKGEAKPFHDIVIKFRAGGETMSVRIPDSAVRASLLAYDVLLEEWKIMKTSRSDNQP